MGSGVFWDVHQLCVQAQGTVLMPSARTLLMASFGTKTSGKDGESNAGCALHQWSGKADECLRAVLSQWNSQIASFEDQKSCFHLELNLKNLTAMVGVES